VEQIFGLKNWEGGGKKKAKNRRGEKKNGAGVTERRATKKTGFLASSAGIRGQIKSMRACFPEKKRGRKKKNRIKPKITEGKDHLVPQGPIPLYPPSALNSVVAEMKNVNERKVRRGGKENGEVRYCGKNTFIEASGKKNTANKKLSFGSKFKNDEKGP